jgi:hypothetical protein
MCNQWVSFLMMFLCSGYRLINLSLFPNSKSANSNPGATVQPIKANEDWSCNSAPNQMFCFVLFESENIHLHY